MLGSCLKYIFEIYLKNTNTDTDTDTNTTNADADNNNERDNIEKTEAEVKADENDGGRVTNDDEENDFISYGIEVSVPLFSSFKNSSDVKSPTYKLIVLLSSS